MVPASWANSASNFDEAIAPFVEPAKVSAAGTALLLWRGGRVEDGAEADGRPGGRVGAAADGTEARMAAIILHGHWQGGGDGWAPHGYNRHEAHR